MRIRTILRLIWAFTFATLAAIFSQLIPPLSGTDLPIIRVLLTVATAGIGYVTFPKVAHSIKVITMSTFNFVVHRVSSEVSNQLIKFTRPNFPFSSHPTPQIGSIALTKPLILDTSAIIDGRILDIVKTGFISGLILIPKFVLLELQQVSDSSADLKRARGRRGFEVVEELKKNKHIKIEIWDKEQNGKTVDEKLINLAKALHGKLITTDFNLNRLATVSNVSVLNINDLANAVKTIAIPGETIELKIVHIGKDTKQGVGYLNDGTMIIVEDGADAIGKTVKVEISRLLQASAGRMFFSKLA